MVTAVLRCASQFSQVLSLINRHQFAAAAKTFRAEKGAKGFSYWDQFVAMLFCQLAQAKSLREVVQGLLCCEGRLQHLLDATVIELCVTMFDWALSAHQGRDQVLSPFWHKTSPDM